MDGTFSIVFSGVAGQGMGVFVVRDGVLTGAGVGGGQFRGHVTVDPTGGALHVVFDHFVPAGLPLVQGSGPYNTNVTMQGEADFPPEFGDGAPIVLKIGGGLVTVMVKREPDEHAHYAKGMALTALHPA